MPTDSFNKYYHEKYHFGSCLLKTKIVYARWVLQLEVMQELPFPGQTEHDIELSYGSAKAKIRFKMDTSGFLEFIKGDELNSLCNPYHTLRSEYYSEDEFIKKMDECNKTLTIISFNIRSLPRPSGELLVFLDALEIPFHVIVLSEIGARNIGTVEHFLSYNDLYYVLPKENNFGGVGIYVHNDLDSVQIMDDLSVQETCRCSKCNVESVFIKFIYHRKSYILGGIYRHPSGSIQHFLTNLEETLSKIRNKHTALITDDINIDLIKLSMEDNYQYNSTLMSYGYLPYIILQYYLRVSLTFLRPA